MFMFLSEIKTTVSHSMNVLNGLRPNFVCGEDAVGSRGWVISVRLD